MFKDSNIIPFKKKVWLSSPTMHGDELKYIEEAYETNWMSTIGENIDEVERIACEQVGRKYSVALSSGTAALHMAVKLAGIKIYGEPKIGQGVLAGKKVFCSDMTFGATVNPIMYEGGIPVFIDSEYETWNMDPIALERAFELYSDVKIVVLVHLYGTPANMDKIKEICDRYGAIIIEDASESLGATYKNTQTGKFGYVAVQSYNGNKIITGSSGGILLTDIEKDAQKVKKWSTQSRDNAPWYQHSELGYNYRMSNIIAAVVRGQYKYLEDHIERKKNIYEKYREGLKGIPIKMNPIPDCCKANYWLSCIIIDSNAMCKQIRDENKAVFYSEKSKSCPTEILEAISSINAEGRPIWKPMHLQPIYKNFAFITKMGSYMNEYESQNYDKMMLDVGNDIFQRGLCLPSDNKMTEEQQFKIIQVIKKCFC